MDTTVIAALAAPVLGSAIWWLLHLPGRIAARWVWKYLPYGKLRDLLLSEGDLTERVRPSLRAKRSSQPALALAPVRRPQHQSQAEDAHWRLLPPEAQQAKPAQDEPSR